MQQAIVKLPDWQHPQITGKEIDLAEVENLKVTGSYTVPAHAFSRMPKLISVEIDDDVTGIETNAFYSCPVLKEVSLGKGLQFIGDSAFSICKSITKVEVPGNVQSLGAYAFFGCDHIEKVILHEGVESIGNMAFKVCSNLTEIVFPNTIKHVEGYVFDDSKWQANHTEDFVILGKTLFHYQGAEHHLIHVPEGIEVISSTAFNMRSFYDISLPSSLRYICDRAFQGNHFIEKILLPDGLIEIGREAFNGADKLRTISIPDSVLRVGHYAMPINTIEGAPKTGYVVAGRAVVGCNGNQKRVVIREGAFSISPYAFYQKYKLKEVVLPKTMREIYNDAFHSCTHLRTILIPAEVTLIEERAIDSDSVTIITSHGSVAEEYARRNHLNVEYIEAP